MPLFCQGSVEVVPVHNERSFYFEVDMDICRPCRHAWIFSGKPPWSNATAQAQARALLGIWRDMPRTKARKALDPLSIGGRILDLNREGAADSILTGAWFLPVEGWNQDGPTGVFDELPVGRL